ncbi:venom protein 302-like [Limulus polyphemus]|uniref:Venom protein 302-like n=1 Tax=Limulus polyphemus TaxID=6850 RepID=A0ABM1BS59_LIMPO|nr:venom protein 302-like [Limulus polyphemus]
MGNIYVFVVILLVCFTGVAYALTCRPCELDKCSPLDPSDCSAGTTTDECRCCTVCGKGEGELCEGPWHVWRGKCAEGLICVEEELRSDTFTPLPRGLKVCRKL